MRPDKCILRVVEILAVIADEGIESSVLAAPRITEPATVGVVTDERRESVGERILFLTAVPFHDDVGRCDSRTGRIGSRRTIVEVPTRKRVESYKHSRHDNWPTDRAKHAG